MASPEFQNAKGCPADWTTLSTAISSGNDGEMQNQVITPGVPLQNQPWVIQRPSLNQSPAVNGSHLVQPDPAATAWRTKRQMAEHFQVSIRTITNLMSSRIIPSQRLCGLVRFDEGQCDAAFTKFKCASVLKGASTSELSQRGSRQWRTKKQIAAHLGCSYRTVGNLMCRRVLPFVKIGNLVRFDLDECDHIMEFRQTSSLFDTVRKH